jgi:hypothetical protein
MQLWLWEGLSPGQGKNRNIVEIWKLDSVKKKMQYQYRTF